MTDLVTGRNVCGLLLSVLLAGVASAVPAAAQEGEEEEAPQEVRFGDGVTAGRQGAEGRLRDRLAVFGDWFQRSMDIECSGWVPVARLVEIMDPGRSRPRQMNWVMALDADGDGFVEPGEVDVGMRENLEHQVERRMLGDVDGDDVLSPREYALFVPDPGAETNEERVSERQEASFAALDRNGDRRVSRGEIADSFTTGYVRRHWGALVLFHLGRADSNGDGVVGREELTGAIEAGGGSVAPEALDIVFGIAAGGTTASAPRLVLSELPAALIEVGTTAAGRARLEAPLASLLAPVCHPSASGSP